MDPRYENQREAERSAKQQRTFAEGQENSSMSSHDQAESSLKPVRLAAKDPSVSHEFQVAHDEHGGMRQKEYPTPSFADTGALPEDSIHIAPSPLATQGNTREHGSSSHIGDSLLSSGANDVVHDEPPAAVSQPGEVAAPQPIHPAHVEIESAQSTPTDSLHFPSSSKALAATSSEIDPAPTLESAAPQFSRSPSKKRTTWYGMEVPDNDDPVSPKKANPFSLGFGYKEHKKAALAAASASARNPVMPSSPDLSSTSSPLTDSSASANPASVQPLRPEVASNIAALRSFSFSPSQDRPVHIQETMHAPKHHTAAASTAMDVAHENAPAPSVAPSSTAPVSDPSISATTESPSHPPAAVLTTPTRPRGPKAHYLSKSGSFKQRISSSPRLSKALKNMPANMRRSHVPTGPVVMKAPPAPAEKLPGAFPDSPVVAPADTPAVARSTTPSVVPVYSTPTASNDNLPIFVRPDESTAGAAHVQDPKAVVPAFSTPTLRHSDIPTTVSDPTVASHPVAKESAPASKSTIATAATAVAAAAAGVFHMLSDHSGHPTVTPGVKETVADTATVPAVKTTTLPVKHSTAAALKTPKKDLSLYDEEEGTYPRGDEDVKTENPAHPAVVEDVIEVNEFPKEAFAALAVPAAMASTLPEHHSTAAALKQPKKDLSLYDEEESTYPRGDGAITHENPPHPSVVHDVIEVNKFPKEALAALAVPAVMASTLPEHHSTAAALKTPKKDLSLYDEEESTYPRGDGAIMHENPPHPPVVHDVIEVNKFPKEALAALAVPAVMASTLPEHHSTAAALKKPKKDLSLYDEEDSTYPRGDEAITHENPPHPSVVHDVIEVNKFPKEALAALAIPAVMASTLPEHHSTAAALKTPKKDLSLYDEEEGTYPRGDGAITHENPPHPSVVHDVIEVNKFPKEAFAALAVPPIVAATVPEHHSTAAALKKPKKDLSLYDEEESTYPRGDEADQHENPAHLPGVKDIVEVAAVPVVMDGARRGSQSGMKEKMKGVFSGFHMPLMGRKKDEKDAEVGATTTTTTSPTDLKSGMAAAVAVPVAATIAAALRDTPDDEPSVELPHHRWPWGFTVTTEPFFHKPAAPLIDEEKATPISARKLEPLSVLPPSGSVIVTDKATTTEPAHSSHEVASHPHTGAATPVVIAAATTVLTASVTTMALNKETSGIGTSTHHPTAAATAEHPTTTAAEHPTATSTPVDTTGGVSPVPVTPVETTSTTEAYAHPSETEAHSTPVSDSFKTKAALLAAAVTAPLVAARDKLTGHHHDDKPTHTTTPVTETVPGSDLHASRRASAEVRKEETVVAKRVIGKAPDDIASKIPHNDDEEVVMVETITTKTVTTIPPTPTHVYEPVEDEHTEVDNTETHAARHVGASPIEAKPVEVDHTKVKHEPSSTNSVVAAVTGAASAVAAVLSGRRHSTVSNTDKAVVEKGHEVAPATATVPHDANEDTMMMTPSSTTTTASVESSPHTHVVSPVAGTHVTKAGETIAAAVPVSAATADSTIHPIDKQYTEGMSVTPERAVVGEVPGTAASAVPHEHDEDVETGQTVTNTTEDSPATDVKGKHVDRIPVVAAAVTPIVVETASEPDVAVSDIGTKEAEKEKKKQEKLAKKEAKNEAKKNQVPLTTKINKFTGAGIAAATAAAVSYKDRLPGHSMPTLQVTEEDVKKPSMPVVAAPLLTMTEDDVDKPEIPEVPKPIFTVTEDDIVVPYPVLTKHPVLTVTEDDVEYPSPLDAPHPVIPYVEPKLVSTSALKVASAPRPMIPDQPAQGKDIKLPKVTIPKMAAPKMKSFKMPTLKRRTSKVNSTAAAVVPDSEPVEPVDVLEVPEPVVETSTTRVVEPVVVRKQQPPVSETAVEPPKPAVEAPKTVVFDAPKVEKASKVVEAPKFTLVEPLPKPVIVETPKPTPAVIETPKPVEVPKPVIAEVPPKTEVEESSPHPAPVPVPVVAASAPTQAPAPAPAPAPTPTQAPAPTREPAPAPTRAPAPAPAPASAPAPVPEVVPTISTNVETVVPEGYSGAVPPVGADESLIWVKKVHTKNDYYDSDDEDELDEFGYRKDRDVSRYVTPGNKTGVRGGHGTAVSGADQGMDYTSENHTNAGIENSSQPKQTTIGGYNTQPRQSAL